MSTFRRLFRFLRPYRAVVMLAVLLGMLTVTSSTLLLAVSAYVIAAAALRPLLVQLTLPIYLVRFVGFSRAIARYAERIVSHNTTFRLLATVRTWFYGALEPLAPARLLAYRSGDLLTRITDDIEELQNLYQQALAPVLIALLTAAATFAALLRFDPAVAWVTLGFLIIAGVGVPLLAWSLARGYGQRERALMAERNACLVDGIQGVQDLLAFGREGDQRAQVAALDRALGAVQRRMAMIAGIQGALGELIASLAMVAVLALAIPLVGRNALSGVYLGVLALVALGAFDALAPLATAFQFLGRSLAAGSRLFAVVDTAPAVTDPPAPLPTPQMPLLEFDHVRFRYAADEPETLHDVSFTVAPGSHVAIVGPSGSGKSTLVRLAARFWDPDAGAIRLGGHDLRAYAQDDLRCALGIVAQDTYLFNTTVRANLRLACPDATDDDCRAALAGAQLDTWLAQLPQGLDSWIGEEGLRLSGGERQRLAIARALLQDAPILILDEPTANLDPRTERVLLARLHTLMSARTTLMITHRLVAMDAWDEILVLDRGRIVERDTHATLKAAGGSYARLLAVQNDFIADAASDAETGS